MSKLQTYVAVLRVVYSSRSPVHAERTAEWFRDHVEHILDPDDEVTLTQCLSFGAPETPEAQILALRKARNELVRLKYTDTVAAAQQLDMFIFRLERNLHDNDVLPDYDYNRIVDITSLIDAGKEPLI